MAHSDEIKKKIIEMKEAKISSRKISNLLFGSESKKSSVNAIYNRHLEELKDESDPEWILDDIKLEELTNSSDEDVASLAKKLRTAQKANNHLRKIQRETLDSTLELNSVLEGIQRAVSSINLKKAHIPVNSCEWLDSYDNVTIEVLFSDFQIGKICQHYNTNLAEKAIIRYGEKVLQNIQDISMTNKVERIVFAMLGDTVEDHLKHGVQSATSTDSGLAEQIFNAIDMLWKYIVQPIAALGIDTEVICIAGNHGSSQHKGMDMYKAGLFSYDYPIYKTLELLCQQAGYDNVDFIVPEGVFGYTEIYGNWVVYEHGYFNSGEEKSMRDQMKKRGQQIKRHVELFRCGDKHNLRIYDCGALVLNGAFFGADSAGIEYAGILGFNSIPAQALMVHKAERSIGRSNIKDVKIIQVADGY